MATAAALSSDRLPTRPPSGRAGGQKPSLVQQLSLAACCCCCSLWLASPFPALAAEDFDDPPAAPFTLYGVVSKRYVIERLQEGTTKVVGRDKGVTVTACSSVVEAASETPEWMGVRTGPDGQLCATQSLPGKVEKTSDLKRVCGPPCVRSCRAAIDAYSTRQVATTGYGLSTTDKDRVFKSCTRSCAYGALLCCIASHGSLLTPSHLQSAPSPASRSTTRYRIDHRRCP